MSIKSSFQTHQNCKEGAPHTAKLLTFYNSVDSESENGIHDRTLVHVDLYLALIN